MITDEDIEYVKYCAQQEADKAYSCLDELLNTLRLLNLQHTEKYRVISEAFTALSIVCRYGIDAFEDNNEETNGEW
jgi:hypothetical protein